MISITWSFLSSPHPFLSCLSIVCKRICLVRKLVLRGPDLTNQLVGVLLRFRKELIAFTGDIEAMFYHVRVPEDQRSNLVARR